MAEQSQVKPPLDLAVEVAQRIEIESIRLLSASASQQPQVVTEKPPDIEMEVAAQAAMNPQQQKIAVRAKFTLIGRYPGQTQEPPPLLIVAEFELVYALATLEGLGEAHFRAFGEINGVYNAWPYWREFVQSTLVRMGLPSLTIPVYRPTKKARPARIAHNKTPTTPAPEAPQQP
jgi:preprotein translocase subunit SecB